LSRFDVYQRAIVTGEQDNPVLINR